MSDARGRRSRSTKPGLATSPATSIFSAPGRVFARSVVVEIIVLLAEARPGRASSTKTSRNDFFMIKFLLGRYYFFAFQEKAGADGDGAGLHRPAGLAPVFVVQQVFDLQVEAEFAERALQGGVDHGVGIDGDHAARWSGRWSRKRRRPRGSARTGRRGRSAARRSAARPGSGRGARRSPRSACRGRCSRPQGRTRPKALRASSSKPRDPGLGDVDVLLDEVGVDAALDHVADVVVEDGAAEEPAAVVGEAELRGWCRSRRAGRGCRRSPAGCRGSSSRGSAISATGSGAGRSQSLGIEFHAQDGIEGGLVLAVLLVQVVEAGPGHELDLLADAEMVFQAEREGLVLVVLPGRRSGRTGC